MSNMDDFNEATALILAKLYEAFPQRISFKVTDLIEGADANKLRNYGDTILFLTNEGFIRWDTRSSNESFNHVTLTSKGLTVLNIEPNALQEKISLGTKLMSVVREGSKEVMRTVVQQVIKGAIGYVNQSS
jgi:hypothetical protein